MAKKICVYARTDMAGSDVRDLLDVPDDWESMTPGDQVAYLEDAAKEHMQNCVEYGAYVTEE